MLNTVPKVVQESLDGNPLRWQRSVQHPDELADPMAEQNGSFDAEGIMLAFDHGRRRVGRLDSVVARGSMDEMAKPGDLECRVLRRHGPGRESHRMEERAVRCNRGQVMAQQSVQGSQAVVPPFSKPSRKMVVDLKSKSSIRARTGSFARSCHVVMTRRAATEPAGATLSTVEK